jgi:fatty acid/phospholipid biosynthesis enzyme
VVVCDGFIGNVVLKVSEAVAESIGLILRENVGDNLIRKLGYFMMRPAFRALKRRVDYAEYGGAPLIGINGISIISHGRSTDRAIKMPSASPPNSRRAKSTGIFTRTLKKIWSSLRHDDPCTDNGDRVLCPEKNHHQSRLGEAR